MIRVWIDNGHGQDTVSLGKHSPDMRLQEWRWTRECASLVVSGLKDLNIDAELLVPEKYDVPLKERVMRVNRTCVERGSKNVLLVSIHNNACPPDDGKWHNASYWSAWVYRQEIYKAGKLVQVKEASRESKRLAELFSYEAREMDWKVGRGTYDYKEANYQILRDTLCPAVLTENFFQDNKRDVEYLLSDKGVAECAMLHITTIKRYLYERGQIEK